MRDIKVWLSTLWVFMLLNYLYCDVMTSFDPTVTGGLSREALLAASWRSRSRWFSSPGS